MQILFRQLIQDTQVRRSELEAEWSVGDGEYADLVALRLERSGGHVTELWFQREDLIRVLTRLLPGARFPESLQEGEPSDV